MSDLEIISTAGVPAHRKIRYWNRAVSATLSAAAADPVDSDAFAGQLKFLDVGNIRVAQVDGGASRVRRFASVQRATRFTLALVLSGEIVCRSGGSQIRIGTGDFWLYTDSAGAELLLDRPVSLLVLGVGRDELTRHIGCPEATLSIVASGDSGAGALASSYWRTLWNHLCQDLAPAVAPRFVECALRLVAATYATLPECRPDHSSLALQHRIRIQSYIETHLCEPELSPAMIAAATQMTRGYVHRIFSARGESVARYIMRRRLEESYGSLSDRLRLSRSITTIAFEHGFNSLPHFCRVFRKRYGLTPGELQRRTAGACTTSP